MVKYKVINDDSIHFTDDSGTEWVVPRGHRLWNEHYEPYLKAKSLVQASEQSTESEKSKKRVKKTNPKS